MHARDAQARVERERAQRRVALLGAAPAGELLEQHRRDDAGDRAARAHVASSGREPTSPPGQAWRGTARAPTPGRARGGGRSGRGSDVVARARVHRESRSIGYQSLCWRMRSLRSSKRGDSASARQRWANARDRPRIVPQRVVGGREAGVLPGDAAVDLGHALHPARERPRLEVVLERAPRVAHALGERPAQRLVADEALPHEPFDGRVLLLAHPLQSKAHRAVTTCANILEASTRRRRAARAVSPAPRRHTPRPCRGSSCCCWSAPGWPAASRAASRASPR